jgi:DNA-binding NtrC family response regulator
VKRAPEIALTKETSDSIMTESPRVLIVEDGQALALALAAAVRRVGAASDLAATAAMARKKLRESGPYDAMILDIGLPDENGLAFLGALSEEERLPTLVVTAHGEIENTISARKTGVCGFFTKPLDFDAFTGALSSLLKPVQRVPGPESAPAGSAFIGAAPSMLAVFRQIAHACASDEPVLLRGETGSGKTRAAFLLRDHSNNVSPSFTLHAAGQDDLSRTLEEASGGTLLIEDIAALTPGEQLELVRGMESGATEFPRLLATANQNLLVIVSRGGVRPDLFYRLQVIEVHLPPLRDRLEDLSALIEFFLGQLAPGRIVEIAAEVSERLERHDWPGNLRELRNVLSSSLTAAAGSDRIGSDHLPAYLLDRPPGGQAPVRTLPESLLREIRNWTSASLRAETLPGYADFSEPLEAALIRSLLSDYDGKLARLASDLKANRATLRRRLRGG